MKGKSPASTGIKLVKFLVKKKLEVIVVVAVLILYVDVYCPHLVMPLDSANDQPMKSEQARSETVGMMTLVKTPDAQPDKCEETKVKLRFVF